MIYCFDIDGTICSQTYEGQYEKARPYEEVIKRINSLYDSGNTIKIMTGRGCVSGIDYTALTQQQLDEWGVKYHELIMGQKPHADLFIDDRGINIENWMNGYSHFSGYSNTRGIIAGAFDIIHRGYIEMFKEAKMNCSHLTIALHENPNKDRVHKLIPVQSITDRKMILESIRYVDDVIVYQEEKDFENMLMSGDFDIRFLGEDYANGGYTAPEANIKIYWINRSHGISTTLVKHNIFTTVQSRYYNE